MLAMPPHFDGIDDSVLEPFLISNDVLIDLIKATDHPESNNVKLVLKSTSVEGE